MEIKFSIWIATKTRWAHLTKKIDMMSVPKVGEFVKFTNAEMGDYFPWEVTQVTYRENGEIEVWTELLDNIDDRGYSFETEQEFDECYQSYLSECWVCDRGPQENTRYKNTKKT